MLPLELPDFKKIFKDYDRFDVGAIGEFDVAVLAEQYAGEDVSKKIYPNWRGGYYYSVHPKGNPGGTAGPDVRVALVKRQRPPRSLPRSMPAESPQRYKNVEANPHSDLDLKKLETLSGDYTWLTEEGPVVIAVRNDTVLVTESLDPAITEEFRHAVLWNGMTDSQ